MINAEQIIRENARRNAEKKKEYNPVTGLNCYGERFELAIEELHHTLYLPKEMADLPSVRLLRKNGSIDKSLQVKLKRKSKATQDEIDFFLLNLSEERYKYDFEFYAVSLVTIRDKESGLDIAFRLNPAQRAALSILEEDRKAGVPILLNVLKAKQMGLSTFIEMYMKWIQTIHKINWNSLVCAHTADASRNIRAMYKYSMSKMPPIGGVRLEMAAFEGTMNIKEIVPRGCRITVGTASEPDSVRSQDLKMVHFSEIAFYPTTAGNNPSMLESSIISSMTDGPYTMIVRETTANGEGDYFHEQWQKAKRGETAFRNFFAPWFMISLYEELFNGSYYMHNGKRKRGTVEDFISTLNEYELNLWTNHKTCTLENLNWRRKKAATMPSESKMKQEYPSDDIEAFQASGSPVFNVEHIEALRADCCPPIEVGKLISDCPPEVAIVEPRRRADILKNIRFERDDRATKAVLEGDAATRLKGGINRLHIWEYPDKEQKISNRYVVVFDPQRGRSESADYGVIKVIDRYWMMTGGKPEVVAMFYGRIDKDVTIWIAAMIAKYYNDALLVVESNVYDGGLDVAREDESEFIFDTIAEYYDNLYSRTPAEKIKEGAPIEYGFHTSRNTKPMLISTYEGIIRERAYIERDSGTLDEARTFERKKDGKTGAKEKHHDDRIMATMIGLYVCYKMPIPRKIEAVKETTKNSVAAW